MSSPNTMTRFDVMVCQLAGLPLPPLPEVPGRAHCIANPDEPDALAQAWEAINGPPPEDPAPAARCSKTSKPGSDVTRGALPRLQADSGALTRVDLAVRALQRAVRAGNAEPTPGELWPLLHAELEAEGLEPVEAVPGELRFRGGVLKLKALPKLASRAREKQAAEAIAR